MIQIFTAFRERVEKSLQVATLQCKISVLVKSWLNKLSNNHEATLHFGDLNFSDFSAKKTFFQFSNVSYCARACQTNNSDLTNTFRES